QTITVTAGTTLTFDFDFLTGEATTATNTFNDFAFYSFTPAGSIGTATTLVSTRAPGFLAGAGGFSAQTGYRTVTFTFTATATYTIGFGVLNVQDTGVASALLVDRVALTPGARTVILGPAQTVGGVDFGNARLAQTPNLVKDDGDWN